MSNRFALLPVEKVVERPEFECGSEEQKMIVKKPENEYKNTKGKRKFMFRLVNENGECKIARTIGYTSHLAATKNNDMFTELTTIREAGDTGLKKNVEALLGDKLPTFTYTTIPENEEIQPIMTELVNEINAIITNGTNDVNFRKIIDLIKKHMEQNRLLNQPHSGGAKVIQSGYESVKAKFVNFSDYLNNNQNIVKSIGVGITSAGIANYMGVLGSLISMLLQILTAISKEFISLASHFNLTDAITNISTLRTREAAVSLVQRVLNAGIQKPEMLTTLSVYGSYFSLIIQLFGTYRICRNTSLENCTLKVVSTRVVLEVVLGTISLLPHSLGYGIGALGAAAATASATMTGVAVLGSTAATIMYIYNIFTNKKVTSHEHTVEEIKKAPEIQDEGQIESVTETPVHEEDQGYSSNSILSQYGGRQRKRSHRRSNSNRRQNKRSHRRQNKRSNRRQNKRSNKRQNKRSNRKRSNRK